MDLNREFDRTARLSFEFQSGPRQFYRPSENKQDDDYNDRFEPSFHRMNEGLTSYIHNQNVGDQNYDASGGGGEGRPVQLSDWTEQGSRGGRGDYDQQRFNNDNSNMSSAMCLIQQSQQRPIPIGPSNLSSIIQLAAELVSQKLEAKLAPPPPIQLYSINSGGNSSVFGGPSHDAPPTELITGVVTQIQDTFGMISGDVFFLFNTVTGDMPTLGDKVVVEAFPVSGMPFKFNAKRVQVVSQDFTPSSTKSGPNPTLNFGPLPKMPSSLNLLNRSKSSKPRDGSNRKSEEQYGRRHTSNDKKSTKHSIIPNDLPVPPPYRSGGILSFNLSDEIPVIKTLEKPQQQNRNRDIEWRSPSPKRTIRRSKSRSPIELFSISRQRRQRSRSSERSHRHNRRVRSHSKSPATDVRRQTPILPSPSDSNRNLKKDIQITQEGYNRAKLSKQDEGDVSSPRVLAGRRQKRPPRSMASIIRYHIATPPPEEERFVPNPCARNPQISAPIKMQSQHNSSGPSRPSVMYLHNPNFEPALKLPLPPPRGRGSGGGLINKIARDSERDNILQKLSTHESIVSQTSLDRFLNERKLSEIEAQRKQLQAQKKALESEMKKSRKESSNKSTALKKPNSKKQNSRKEEIKNRNQERNNRGMEGPVRRLEMDEIGHSSKAAKKVEWITPAEFRNSGGRRDEPQDRVQISREPDFRQHDIRWELPPQRNTRMITDVEREEEQLSEREKEVLQRMWVIQSQRERN